MGELRQGFLNQTITNLKLLQKESFGEKILSEDFLTRFFRQLHTIKGTSRTFNLNHLAYLAHETENLLEAVQTDKIPQTEETKNIFADAFRHLLQIAEAYKINSEASISQDFIAKIRSLIPDLESGFSTDFLLAQIPDDILSQLATEEKNNLSSAIQKGKSFYLIKAFFAMMTFYEDFKSFKQTLIEHGEVIAVLPGKTENPTQEIAFQIFFVSNLTEAAIEKFIQPLSVRIGFENISPDESFSDDLEGISKIIVAKSEKTASLLGKQISFQTAFDKIQISNEKLILLNEIAAHLLNNAIDHAVEPTEERIKNGKNPTATIKISITFANNEILLQIEDDGKGIDVEKISEQARKKNLIAFEQILDEQEALKLIFSPGFSTGEKVSKISGRGVGLDAVKYLVEKNNGKIEVQTELGKGTSFYIYLPQS